MNASQPPQPPARGSSRSCRRVDVVPPALLLALVGVGGSVGFVAVEAFQIPPQCARIPLAVGGRVRPILRSTTRKGGVVIDFVDAEVEVDAEEGKGIERASVPVIDASEAATVAEYVAAAAASPDGNEASVGEEESGDGDGDGDGGLLSFPSYLPILSLCFCIALLSALDRVAMSVAILPLSSDLHLSETVKGQVSSVFSIGYGLAILPCGLLVAAVSPTAVMAGGIVIWSAATLATPLAADAIRVTETAVAAGAAGAGAGTAAAFAASNVGPLLAARSVMGASESVVLPAIQRILINWVPAKRRSRSIASVYAGFQTGTILAYFLSPTVIDSFGWRGMFYAYGAAGAALVPMWLALGSDGPEGTAATAAAATTTTSAAAAERMSKDEEEIEGADRTAADGGETVLLVNTLREDDLSLVPENVRPGPDEDILADCVDPELPSPTAFEDTLAILKSAPWGDMLRSPGVWAMTLAHAANNWGLYNNLSWTPTFYSQFYGLNVKDSALLSILPSIAGAVGGLAAGTIADKVIQSLVGGGVGGKGDGEEMDEEEALRRTTLVRKIFQCLALAGPSLCIFYLSRHIPDDPHVAQTLLTASVGMQAFNAAGYGAATQEKAGERWAGLLYSVTSLPGVMLGSTGVYVTGRILDVCRDGPDMGWGEVFGLTSAVFAAGAMAFVLLYDARREFD